jgi:hypothetical protein
MHKILAQIMAKMWDAPYTERRLPACTMVARLIDGVAAAAEVRAEVAQGVARLLASTGVAPGRYLSWRRLGEPDIRE